MNFGKERRRKIPRTTTDPDYANKIANALINCGFLIKREHAFLTKRNFRFDFLILSFNGENLIEQGIRIAIEYEGGIQVNGRHTRPKGYNKDCQKYNLAALNNYIVLRYTSKTIGKKNGEYLVPVQVQQLIEQIKNNYNKEIPR